MRKSGKHVRITAQLIQASADTQLWSQTYDRTFDDIFAIQDQIAADVVKQLKVTLLGAVPAVRKTDPEAYALFLQAVQLGRQGTAEGYTRSNALFRRVLEIDPRYAPAWDELSRNSLNLASSSLLSNEAGDAQAREEARKAIEIDPGYAPAYAKLGRIANDQADLAGAVRLYERALELAPMDLTVLEASATLLDSLGRPAEALTIREFVVARDPVNPAAFFNLGRSYRANGRLDEAIASCKTALSLSPGSIAIHSTVGEALLLKGRSEAGLEEFQRETSEAYRLIGLTMAYHALGRKPESDAALAEMIKKYEKDAAYNIAYAFAFRGDADRAFEWLDKAAAYDDPGLSEIFTQLFFANIQKDPRWLPFLRKIGRAPEQLAAFKFSVKLPDR